MLTIRLVLAIPCFALSGLAQTPAVRAKLVEVVSKPLEGTASLPGELRAFRTVGVQARVSGFVETVHVDRGSRVRKGDLLAKLTAPELQARIAELLARVVEVESRRAETQARLVGAESTLSRLREAAKTPGAVAGNDIVQAEAAQDAERGRIVSIEKSVEAAKASVAALEETMRYLEVRAEFGGIISERLAHEGSLAGPENKDGTPLFRLEQVDQLRLVVAVPEALVGGIRRGARVAFSVAAYPGDTFSGVVARPALSLEAKTRTMPVELDVQNPRGRLAPGMYAEVAWPQGRGHSSLLVPPRAVKATTERIFVIRVTDGIAEWVDVRRGAQVGDLVEVFGGLRPGDRIFERATDEVRPGAMIVAE